MPRYDDYSREELVRLLEARDRRDATRFGLVWETNEVEREKALNGDFVALDLDAALSTAPTPGPEGEDAAWRNLIIEGDNFDALRFLRMAYAGRVKCICIDPPYNTGNRDFVYNDRYVDKDDAWRHSRWCEFMHQRLTLAKELLAQDGVIFVFRELPKTRVFKKFEFSIGGILR
jgi:adenine-specific DNA-methyltransferase